ncbi:calcium/sodium antiporter [Sulfuriroseicoccus oceanibius]|uniref:Calcium/sodium antiporter n=1 Tax=Sulfuriroseicoccus oceanibius TaxID=2707525 RepID=A0A6B3L7H8_9BACT|nr:calcium/sodium antiporter [Sulfuriroseicoccus oceanibius]QQL44397.1 calcium/sodium antiporter [Sulfuriroseicoccus oceanibius]
MDLTLEIVFVIAGLALLYYGAEWLVAGAAELAVKIGMSPLVVGLTVVAFGTSAPELLVSLQAAFDGAPDISVGNIVGSNICNLALIIGVGVVITPLVVHGQVVKREMPILLLSTALFIAFLSDGQLARWEGFVLFGGIIVYVVNSVMMSKRHMVEGAELEEFEDSVPTEATHATWKLVALVLVGIAAMVLGSKLLVENAQSLALRMGVSEAVIGLTLIAFGTSLPELATAVVSALKKQGDIMVGNAVGSNIFNTLLIMGATASVHPIETQSMNPTNLYVMAGVTLLIFPMMITAKRLSRIEGVVLLVGYAAYCVYAFTA